MVVLPESPVGAAYKRFIEGAKEVREMHEVYPYDGQDELSHLIIEVADAEDEWGRVRELPRKYAWEHGHEPGVLVTIDGARVLNPLHEVAVMHEAARVRLCKARAQVYAIIAKEATRRQALWEEAATTPQGRLP